KFPVKTILAILLFKQYYNLPLRDAQHYGRNSSEQTFTTQPSTTGRKAEPRRTDKPPPEKLQKLPYASTQADSTIITNKKG
ncbi:hypothetical protein, partial [Thermococcus sp. PK]|uniref:hypothetical protein n=1 Tax=Thermococcus sp. PK TaxID=913025 RepID=UPI0005B2663A